MTKHFKDPVMSPADCKRYLNDVFPETAHLFDIEAIDPMTARVRLNVEDGMLRPGGTVSGPSMFLLADCTFYVALLGMIGERALAVTTNVSINFMNRPAPEDLICEARIMKLGRLLATGDATITDLSGDVMLAHAAMTYAIPPQGDVAA